MKGRTLLAGFVFLGTMMTIGRIYAEEPWYVLRGKYVLQNPNEACILASTEPSGLRTPDEYQAWIRKKGGAVTDVLTFPERSEHPNIVVIKFQRGDVSGAFVYIRGRESCEKYAQKLATQKR